MNFVFFCGHIDYDLQVVSCTACGQQVNHFHKDAVYRHPALKVLICKVSHLVVYKTKAEWK